MLEFTRKAAEAIADVKSRLLFGTRRIIHDPKVSLPERWDLFVNVGEFVFGYKPWVEHPEHEVKCMANLSWYDDFYINRYQNVVMPTIVEQMRDRPDKYSPECITEFQEWCLRTECYGFVMDW